MASFTPHYNLAIFDFGDQLDAPLNVQREIDRFLVIDKQLYALFSIFGSGVINGWIVEDNGFTTENGISVSISPGLGIIRYIGSETTFPASLDGLPPNSIVKIYAVLRGSTPQDRIVDFAYSSTELGDFAILLAEITTGQAAVTNINNNIRQLIGFKEIIKQEIDIHKHRGTPSKIDLQDETKNQLPGAKIEGIDADKIISGIFDIERLPLIDHDDLEFDGILTHAQLDSFVKTFNENNKQLLGEITSVNLLRLILFIKSKYVDVDEHFVNELAIIPGISPDEFIDFEASTAYINLQEKCISGRPPKKGEFVDITWNTQTAFANAFKSTNIVVQGGKIFLARDNTQIDTIENFETTAGSGGEIPGFSKDTEVVFDNFNVVAESATTLRTEGFFSGKFTADRRYKALFSKTFSEARDWSKYDELILNIKTLTVSHGSVFCYFVTGTGASAKNSSIFMLLSEDEVTDNSDTVQNDFELRTFDISEENRTNVTKFVIFCDDITNAPEFFVDDVYVRTSALFAPQGTINLRYSSSASVTFHSIFYDAVTPEDTSVKVRLRTAASGSLLTRASYSNSLRSGDVIALPGTDAEIELQLITNDRSKTPSIESVKLRLLVESSVNGFDIRTKTEWGLGEAYNIDFVDTSGDLANLEISSPINVGGISFSYLQAIREIDDGDIGVIGFSGVYMPVSPNQALNWATNQLKRFSEPVSSVRRFDKNYVVADRDNDRVLLVNSRGKLVRGFGSINGTDEDFYPLSSVYNPNTEVLTIILSRGIDSNSILLEKVSLFIGVTEIPLTASDKIIDNNKSSQIIEIQLSTDKASQLVDYEGDLFVNFKTGAFPLEIAQNNNAAALIGVRGVITFIGDFTYMDGINHPIFVNILSNDNWIVGNSSIEYEEPETKVEGSQSTLKANPSSVSTSVNSQAGTKISGGKAPYSVQTGPNSSIATAQFSGDVLLVRGVSSGSTSLTVQDSSSSPVRLNISVSVGTGSGTNTSTTGSTAPTGYASILEFNPETLETLFSSSSVLFSDFSLGGIYEQSDERIIVAGVYKDPSALSSNSSTSTSSASSSGIVVDADLSEMQKFREAAIDALSDYRGIVAILDKPSNNMVFSYISPDGLYASDVDINEDGNLVVAESSFADSSGRVIVLDDFGNIIRSYGERLFGVVNDAKAAGDGHVLISI